MPIPTVVLVPGAFHVESIMDILGAQLQQKGYDTRTWGLRTVNKPNVSVVEDSTLLAEGILKPLIEQGKDVVLYLHSYAGFPGSAAIAGFSKAVRSAKGLQGGIIGLIFQSAFVPKVGDTLLHMIGGNYAPWQDPDVSLSDLFIEAFYHGLLLTVQVGKGRTDQGYRSQEHLLRRRPRTPSLWSHGPDLQSIAVVLQFSFRACSLPRRRLRRTSCLFAHNSRPGSPSFCTGPVRERKWNHLESIEARYQSFPLPECPR